MSDTEGSRAAIALTAGGPDDPDGRRTASALAAYLRAEQLGVFCRLLWRRLVGVAAVWLLLGWFDLVPAVGLVVGCALFAALAAGAGIADRRARRILAHLLRPPA
ncbi:MAG TPA: hypothetical protein VFB07_03140 [Vicinamibacterales bacterium]|nr:hypothetical protein [Vicinamibacterales bacterium]